MELAYHIPALLNETVEGLEILPDGVYADLTFGGGGHSRAILSHLSDNGKLYGFDQDIDAYANRIDDKRFTFVYSNFRYLSNFMRYYGEEQIDGIVADLGVSFHHFDDEKRGFSFRFEEGELDMRMNRNSSLTARDILNTYTEECLADIFFLFGEMKNSRRVASEIVKARASRPFATTDDFLKVVSKFIKPTQEKKELAQLFQALRIEVNHEMEALKEMLAAATQLLAPGGRLSVITYHSLEDRIVKNVMKTGNAEGKMIQDFYGRIETPYRLVNNKVVVPTDEEQQRNPRSRSAKLRIAEKK